MGKFEGCNGKSTVKVGNPRSLTVGHEEITGEKIAHVDVYLGHKMQFFSSKIDIEDTLRNSIDRLCRYMG